MISVKISRGSTRCFVVWGDLDGGSGNWYLDWSRCNDVMIFPTGTSCSGVTSWVCRHFLLGELGLQKLWAESTHTYIDTCSSSQYHCSTQPFTKFIFRAVPLWDVNQEDLALCSAASLKSLVGLPGAVLCWHLLSCPSLLPWTGKNQPAGRKGTKNSNR